jgi:hypothetical protein
MKLIKTRQIIRQIAQDENVHISQVEDIINVHFEFIRHVQSELVDRNTSSFPSVRVANFAIFYCPDKVREGYKRTNEMRKARENESI